MRNIFKISSLGILFLALLPACNTNENESDAYGNFEAVDYTISAENSGKILHLNLEEGDVFTQATEVGVIDTTQLYLQREQLKSQRKSIAAGIKNILSRIAVYEEQKSIMEKDQARIDQMFRDKAATQKDVDDIHGNILVVQKQIQSVKTENAKVFGELESIDRKMDAISDMIQKSRIFVPKAATVLEKYHETYEMVNAGTPLFKLADLRSLDLRVYVSGDQLPEIKLGQQVKVIIDKQGEQEQSLSGKITWISAQSEFTPKIIQTKKERVKLVYAVKVRVENDGRLKIGMPGEIRWK
ncbi:HlyD family secretion protein [Ancylomarina longa]|uniref:HlyD family efflux transporter periplasmic adaptor subunit n=1 Tax=Ancylomarina longa TaxID=2487017 RepID=A0A434AYF6_9BACT|nr:HlyD family efflux transporter periplasmic adaptor subunit [Ancylomarina longa]RUT79570.1 HlyD family efflux transporter periplasmic adaptor subunit [Ancylomarina longa]